jgi:hypothetical protein
MWEQGREKGGLVDGLAHRVGSSWWWEGRVWQVGPGREKKERKRKRIQLKFETDISNLFKLDSIQTGPFLTQKIWNKLWLESIWDKEQRFL